MDVAARSEDLVRRGIAAQSQARFDDAALLFWRGLACLDALPPGEHRDRAAELAALFLEAGHEDVALVARHTQIRLDQSLNPRRATSGLIALGNLHTNLGNTDEARAIFAHVIERGLAARDYAEAASASTNLAGLLANDGDPREALTLLSRSMEYIRRVEGGFPDTEFNTHAMIIQVAALCGDVDMSVTSAIAIGRAFVERLTPQYRQVLAPLVQNAASAYLDKHPQKNPEQWKKRSLGWAYE